MTAATFRVAGRVQGVSFRAFTQREAVRLGLTGWVLNREDGGVEGFAEGDDAGLDALKSWLAQGPPAARVDALVWEAAVPEGHARFEIRR